MPYSKGNYPNRIKKLPSHAQDIWVSAFNNAIKSNNEESSNKIAWSAVKKAGYMQNDKGNWVKASETFYYSNKLSELSSEIEIMREGKWKHNLYGDFQISKNTMDNIIKNFEDNVRGIDISFDIEHGTTSKKTEAVAWVKKLKRKDGKLLAEVDWTDLGKEKVKSKSFKYFSPEFQFKYTDAETNKTYNNVLIGGGLTNKPFIKKMSPVVLSESASEDVNEELTLINNAMTPIIEKEDESSMNKELLKVLKLSEDATTEQITSAIAKLTEDSVKLAELQGSIETLKKEVNTLKTEKEALNVKLGEATDKKTDAEKENIKLNERITALENVNKETSWNQIEAVALSEGKMTKEMANELKTMYMTSPEATKKLIATLPVVVQLGEQGSSKGEGEVSHIQLFEKEVNKIMETEKLDYSNALVLAEINNPELFKKANKERRGA